MANYGHLEGESMKIGFDGEIKLEFHAHIVCCNKKKCHLMVDFLRIVTLMMLLDYSTQSLQFFYDKHAGRNIQHAMPTRNPGYRECLLD